MSASEDLVDIQNVLALYCHLIDDREWDRLSDVYTPDSAYGAKEGALNQGLPAIVAYLASIPQPVLHLTSDFYINLSANGDRATGRAKWLSVHTDGSLVAGSYEQDVYARTDVGWRIQYRTYTMAVPPRQWPPPQAAS